MVLNSGYLRHTEGFWGIRVGSWWEVEGQGWHEGFEFNLLGHAGLALGVIFVGLCAALCHRAL